MSNSYAHALAEVRSCLAALADASPFDKSVGYENLLLDLDAIHGGRFPSTHPVSGTITALHRRSTARLEELAHLGADPLTIELIHARLEDIGCSHPREPPHRMAHNDPHSAGKSAHSRSSRRRVSSCRSSAVVIRDPHHR